jgi:hypothetical protein
MQPRVLLSSRCRCHDCESSHSNSLNLEEKDSQMAGGRVEILSFSKHIISNDQSSGPLKLHAGRHTIKNPAYRSLY